jgi:hypothetical protein
MSALFAILIRALREHTRSRMLGFARGGFAAMVFWVFLFGRFGGSIAPGLSFLYGILFLNVVFVFLAATSYFSSCITEEKEEGTIALLTMANVSPSGLLLAKSGTRILEGILLLGVQFPFAILAVTLGGVMWHQVAASYLALAAFVFVSGNLALVASVVAGRTSAAVFGTALMLIALFLGDDVLRILGIDGLAAHWHALNPIARLGEIASLTFSGPLIDAHFKTSVFLGIAAFIVARLLFPHFSHTTAESEPGWIRYFTSTAQDRMNAPRAVPGMAIQWKDLHFLYGGNRLRRWKTWGYALVCAVFALLICADSMDKRTIFFIGMVVVAVGMLGMFFEEAYAAAQMFGNEKRDKTLGALILVPALLVSTLYNVKEQIAVAAVRPARNMTMIGCGIILIGLAFMDGINGVIFAVAIGTLIVGLLLPFWFVTLGMLRQIIIYCSLRFAWGSMATGIAIWLVLTLFLLGFFGAVLFGVGAYVALIPILIISDKLKKKNIARLEQLAAQEG